MTTTSVDTGLLGLRLGALVVTILVYVLRTTGAALTFAGHPDGTWILVIVGPLAALVALGVWARRAATLLSIIWFWSAVAGAIWAHRFALYPVRGVELGILYAGLALMGPGRHRVPREPRG